MSVIGAAILTSAVVGGVSAHSAAKKQAKAAKKAAKLAEKQNQQIRDDNAPYRAQAEPALTKIGDLMGTSGNKDAADYGLLTHQFNAADLKSNLAPNYDFMLQQGLGATTNAANASGFSGNALKGINDYVQGYAGNAYQQAYNNYTGNQTNIYNRLSNLAGFGQTANQITANAGTALTGQQINAQMTGAAANAAGIVGGANALNNGVSNYAGWNYLNKVTPSGTRFNTGYGSNSAGGSPDGYWADGGPVRHYAWGGSVSPIRSMTGWGGPQGMTSPLYSPNEPTGATPEFLAPPRRVGIMPPPRMDTQPGYSTSQLGPAIGGNSLNSVMNYGGGPAMQPPKQTAPKNPWMGNPRLGFEGGGEVDGPGGPTDDEIPAMLSDGEHVVTENEVTRLGGGDNELGQLRMTLLRNMIRRGHARH